MTDLFVEQPEEELISSLTPSAADEFWDVPDEIGEFFGDIGQAIDTVFTGYGEKDEEGNRVNEPEGWWRLPYASEGKHIATTLKDLVTREGEFAPQVEEEASIEDRVAQKAQELMPASTGGGDDVAEGAGNTALKALHFERMTGESAFVKFINWLRESGVMTASREGAGIGRSSIYEADGKVSPAFQGDTSKPTANVLSLTSAKGRGQLTDYLRADWRNIPALLEIVQQNVAENWSVFMSGVVDGKKPETPDTAEDDPAVFAELMRQFGGYGDGSTLLIDVDEAFGGGAAADILGGTLNAAIEAYADELVKTNQSMLVGPNLEEEGGMVGFITSFDGTPYGDITSVNDLFSGGKIGPMDAYKYMDKLWENTRDGQGYSAVLEQIQQELFAWGVLVPEDGFEWGKLDVVGMHGMADLTVDALQMFQVDIINTALKVPEGELAADATPYMDSVLQRLISRNVTTGERQGNQAREIEKNTISRISQKIQDRIEANPHRLINEQGVKELETTIQQMINELGSQDREEYFGRGGGAEERQIVDALMADFYGDSNWGEQIFFGGKNTDGAFLKYASRVGALSPTEEALLGRGAGRLDNFRENWDPSDVDSLHAAEKDVVTSNLLKFISNHMTAEGIFNDPEAIRKGLMTYAHTIGQRTAAERGYSDADYRRMVDSALRAHGANPAESPLVATLDDRLAESMDLVGGNAPDFRRLMDSVDSRRRSLNTLRVRNV